jgi:C-methyltransferase-like protein/putative zinc binding protein/methyltransferase family protein
MTGGCRLCAAALTETFVDLGMAPLSGRPLTADRLDAAETLYPLHVRICTACLLVQLPAYGPTDAVEDGGPARGPRFADAVVEQRGLGGDSLVVEVDGSGLLPAFAAHGVPVRAVESGDMTESADLEPARADVVASVDAYARVADLVGFTARLAALAKPDGLVVLEFPHLLRMVERRQYDAIDHRHRQYLSLLTAGRALATAGLVVVDVDELSRCGGSLRVCARPRSAAGEPSSNVKSVLDAEAEAGLHTLDGHRGFASAVFGVKRDLVEFLLAARADGRRVVGYGTAGTLLDHCGVRSDLLAYTVDGVGAGGFLPGSRIPVHDAGRIAHDRPDYVLVLAPAPRPELCAQLDHVRSWGGRLVFAIPDLEVV